MGGAEAHMECRSTFGSALCAFVALVRFVGRGLCAFRCLASSALLGDGVFLRFARLLSWSGFLGGGFAHFGAWLVWLFWGMAVFALCAFVVLVRLRLLV